MPESVNRQQLTPEEVASIQLRIFDALRRVCRANGLTCLAYYGTLIGCARHGGFIPWDDDIDVAVPRADYERMMELDWEAQGIRMVSRRNSPNFPFAYAKLCDPETMVVENMGEPYTGWGGVNIDIWPLDWVPENTIVRILNDRAVRTLRWIVLAKSIGRRAGRAWWKQLLLDTTVFLTRPLSMDRALAATEKLIIQPRSSLLGCRLGGIGPKQWFPAAWLTPPASLPFEGRQVNVPREYDRVLRTIYGDYLQLPPEESRVSTHSFTAYRIS